MARHAPLGEQQAVCWTQADDEAGVVYEIVRHIQVQARVRLARLQRWPGRVISRPMTVFYDCLSAGLRRDNKYSTVITRHSGNNLIQQPQITIIISSGMHYVSVVL